jgi:3-hydroxypropanoate dehydrogenase
VHLYDLISLAPTSSNTQPLRLVYVKSPEAKERLRPCLDEGNVAQTMAAPVTAIVAYDLEFYEKLPKLAPTKPQLRDRLAARPPEVRERLAAQNATLQAGYLILGARALGLDCGPMGGFDPAKVDAAFFDGPAGTWKSALLVNLGYGDISKLSQPRAPRLDFDEIGRIE